MTKSFAAKTSGKSVMPNRKQQRTISLCREKSKPGKESMNLIAIPYITYSFKKTINNVKLFVNLDKSSQFKLTFSLQIFNQFIRY